MPDNIKSNKKGVLARAAIMAGAFTACTLLCFLLDYFKINDLNFLIIYILGILLTAVLTQGYVYSSALSLLSVIGYNFFFTQPRYTLHFNDKSYLATFILMLVVGIGIGGVTYQLKKKMAQINTLNMEKARLRNEAEKEQMKATLLRSISHDLRTPLTTMKNGAEFLLKEDSVSLENRKEILESIASKANWTIRLVENLLSLSRIDSQKLTVKKTPEALEEIIPQALRTVQGALGERTISYDMPPEMLLAPMDATLIIQAISNILNNAIKHTANDGKIEIKAWNSGRNVIMRISNDGEQIREEDLPHLFEAYFRGEDADVTGSGLGLSICELIINAHGGSISARNIENGVAFELILPLENQDG